MKIQHGFHHLFRKRDSRTGFKMLETGASQETDTGVTQFLFGSQTMEKKLSVLDLLKNFKSFLDVVRLLTSTERALITLLFHQRKVKDNLRESLRFSIAGLRVVQCLLLKATTLSPLRMMYSQRDSQVISSLKVLTKPEDGSIP